MVAPSHQSLDPLRRSSHLFGVMAFVGQNLLFRQHDRNGGNALAFPVADRRSNAGNRVVRLGDLDRQPLPESLACRIRKRARIDLSAPGRRGAGAALEQFYPLGLRQVADKKPAGRRPIQWHARADTRGNLKMAWAVRHRKHEHVVAIATADLHGFAGLPAKIMHLVSGNAHEVQRPGIGEAIVIEARTKPDRPVRVASQHVLFDQIVDDNVDGGKRSPDCLGNRVSTRRRTGFVKIINNLQRTVNTAHARAPRAFGVGRLDRCGLIEGGCG